VAEVAKFVCQVWQFSHAMRKSLDNKHRRRRDSGRSGSPAGPLIRISIFAVQGDRCQCSLRLPSGLPPCVNRALAAAIEELSGLDWSKPLVDDSDGTAYVDCPPSWGRVLDTLERMRAEPSDQASLSKQQKRSNVETNAELNSDGKRRLALDLSTNDPG
jgi:hypothetical protein